MCETLPDPIGVRLPAGSTQLPSSSGEMTDQDHAMTPSRSAKPVPVQNGGPQRAVQSNAEGSFSALSIV